MHPSFLQNPGLWLCVLSNLVLVMVLLNAVLLWKLFRRANPAAAATKVPQQAPRAPTAVDPVHLAIITAAVSTLIREPHFILSARSLNTSGDWTRSMLSTWAVEGRSAIFSSHKVR